MYMCVAIFSYSCKPVCVCVVFISVTLHTQAGLGTGFLCYCAIVFSSFQDELCVYGYASLLAHSNERHVMLLKSALPVSVLLSLKPWVCLLSGSDWLQPLWYDSALVNSGVNAARIFFTFVLARENYCVCVCVISSLKNVTTTQLQRTLLIFISEEQLLLH